MTMLRLNSSMIATVAGVGFVVAAVAAGTVSQSGSDVAVKGDRLTVATKVACEMDCIGGPDQRIETAFKTIAAHDTDAGVTTLTRVIDTSN